MRGLLTLIGWALFYIAMAFMLAHFFAEEHRRLDPSASTQSHTPTPEQSEPAAEGRQSAPENQERMPCHYGKSIYAQDCAGAPQQPRKIKPEKMPPAESN